MTKGIKSIFPKAAIQEPPLPMTPAQRLHYRKVLWDAAKGIGAYERALSYRPQVKYIHIPAWAHAAFEGGYKRGYDDADKKLKEAR